MKNPEISAEASAESFDFGLLEEEFDINAAFQGAMCDVLTDEELALEEKVRRMEVIVSEGTSDVYRGFVDFQAQVAQMHMICGEDHALRQAVMGSEMLSGFMEQHGPNDGHGHPNDAKPHGKKEDSDDEDEDEDEDESGANKGKKPLFFLLVKI